MSDGIAMKKEWSSGWVLLSDGTKLLYEKIRQVEFCKDGPGGTEAIYVERLFLVLDGEHAGSRGLPVCEM